MKKGSGQGTDRKTEGSLKDAGKKGARFPRKASEADNT